MDIALNAKVSEAYISQIKTGKRKAGFNAQVKIANACGYDYILFLQRGKELLLTGTTQSSTAKIHTHPETQFTHPEPIQQIYQGLKKIDRMAPEKLDVVKVYIDGLLAGLQPTPEKRGLCTQGVLDNNGKG